MVCLNGTPTPEMWGTVLGTRLNHTQVLTDEERREYLTDALNLSVAQSTEHVKPYSSGENVNVSKDVALLKAVARKEEREVDLITTMSARHAYPGDEGYRIRVGDYRVLVDWNKTDYVLYPTDLSKKDRIYSGGKASQIR